METPEIISKTVFNSGKLPAEITLIPSKGHSETKIIEGHIDE